MNIYEVTCNCMIVDRELNELGSVVNGAYIHVYACAATPGQARAMVAKEVGLDFTHLMSIKRVRSNVDLLPCFVSEDIAKAGR